MTSAPPMASLLGHGTPSSTSQARPSGSQPVREQTLQSPSLHANPGPSDAFEPAGHETTPPSASAPVNSFVGPAAASQSPSFKLEPVQEHAERTSGPENLPDTSEPAHPTPASGAPLDLSDAPASASQSPPAEPVQEQPGVDPGPANVSDVDDSAPEPAASSGHSLSAPLASVCDMTTSRSRPSLPVQDEHKNSQHKEARNSADAAKPSDPDRPDPRITSGALSGGSPPSQDPAGQATVSPTPPSYPLKDVTEDSTPSRSEPIKPRDNPAVQTSASAESSSPPA
ncbi:hypothetical protein OH77DRAFT_1570692 [Trametes cingulata]|nr:hypothetical protein OH77DRAFT_1570692 [Trametes cingulata]